MYFISFVEGLNIKHFVSCMKSIRHYKSSYNESIVDQYMKACNTLHPDSSIGSQKEM